MALRYEKKNGKILIIGPKSEIARYRKQVVEPRERARKAGLRMKAAGEKRVAEAKAEGVKKRAKTTANYYTRRTKGVQTKAIGRSFAKTALGYDPEDNLNNIVKRNTIQSLPEITVTASRRKTKSNNKNYSIPNTIARPTTTGRTKATSNRATSRPKASTSSMEDKFKNLRDNLNASLAEEQKDELINSLRASIEEDRKTMMSNPDYGTVNNSTFEDEETPQFRWIKYGGKLRRR